MEIDIEKVKNTLVKPELERGLRQYLLLHDMFDKSVDFRSDNEFQTKFFGFYRVRRNCAFRSMYFDFMEKEKSNKLLDFEDVLKYLYSSTARIEASFSSKLLATINNDMPVWDKYVLENLKLQAPPQNSRNRFNKTIELYKRIQKEYNDFLSTSNARDCIELFDKYFSDKYLTAKLSPLKKIDLILWQMR